MNGPFPIPRSIFLVGTFFAVSYGKQTLRAYCPNVYTYRVIRLDLQLSRDIPILRATRIKNGPLVKGTHPILGDLHKY